MRRPVFLALLTSIALPLAAGGCIKFEDPPRDRPVATTVAEAPADATAGARGTAEATTAAGETATADAERAAGEATAAAATDAAATDAAATAEAATAEAEGTSATPGGAAVTSVPGNSAPSPTHDERTGVAPSTSMPPAATVPPLVFPTRISFAPGAESASVSGVLAAGGDRVGYVLRALAWQTMVILLDDTPPGQVVVDVRGADGVAVGADATSAGLTYSLEKTQDYMILLATIGGAPATSYAMTVYIGAIDAAGEPERIEFAPGTDSATVHGGLAAGGDSHGWVLRALAGQTLRLFATRVPASPMRIEVRDAAGGLLPGSVEGAGWSHDLPRTGDYVITVGTPPGAPQVLYSLTTYVAALEPEPIRIEFAPDAESATVSGGLPEGGGRQDYVLRVMAGQTMHVLLGSMPYGAAELEVRGPSAQFVGVVPDGPARQFELPETGDYTLSVATADGAEATSYSLTVFIPGPIAPAEPERIEFAPGAYSATVAGALPEGGGEGAYVLEAMVGQDMYVNVSISPAGPVAITANDPSGVALPGAAAWAGTAFSLPATGDYTIRIMVPPGAPETSYTMTVSVR